MTGRWKTIFPFLLSGLFVVVMVLNVLVRDPNVYPVLRLVSFLVSIGMGIASVIYAARAYGSRSEHGQALLLIATGMGCILAGDLLFVVLQFFQQTIPLPSLADGLYFLGYFFFVFGFFRELRLYKVDIASIDPFTKLLGGLFVVTLGIIVLYLEVFSAYEPAISLLANLARVSYGIFDFFLIAIMVLMLRMTMSFGKGKLFFPWLMVFFGIASSMVGDILYSLTYDQYLMSVWPYTMLNVFWVGAYLLATYGFVGIGNVVREAQAMIGAGRRQRA